MTLQDILTDIHELNRELASYERKYGVLSETFYEAYSTGQEPPEDGWVRDWTAWASGYEILLMRRQEYKTAIESMRQTTHTLGEMIALTARHESIPVTA